MKLSKLKLSRLIPGLAILLLIVFSLGLILLGDWLWFLSVGYEAVWLKVLTTSVSIGVLSFLVFFAACLVNILIAKKLAKGKKNMTKTRVTALFAALVSLIAGFLMSANWETILKYLNHTSFGTLDPVFSLDIGFYVFSLPFYSLVLNFMTALFIMSAVFAAVSYFIHSKGFKIEKKKKVVWNQGPMGEVQEARTRIKWKGAWKHFMPQISVLLFLVFTVLSAKTWLARYGLLFSASGTVVGASYTEMNVTLPLLTVLSVITFLIGLGFLANFRFKKPELIKYGVAGLIAVYFIGFLGAGVVQGLIVQPNEFNLEKPYLERNIQATLSAYGLGDMQEKTFPVSYNLTARDIQENEATIKNIRLWDWRPLKQTYNQLQLFRTYYDFVDVDIDRYQLDGMYKQVLVSPREMNTDQLQNKAQTWVNRHLVYTHGHGVVMNPVDRVSEEGLPLFYIKDIPPKSDYFDLEQPQIYFGERTDNYAITGTSTEEFDYPSGEENIYTSYQGSSGVPLGDFLTRLAYAVKFSTVELLVSGSITPESRLLMRRNIGERVPAIAPFLSYDYDPYIVTSGGRLYWILDAYTTTDMYPYSQPVRVGFGRNINYIRNPVKVVTDAYTGEVHYYIVDDSDPIIRTYRNMFPDLFSDFEEMPEDLKDHIRYPEDILNIQAKVYSTYHMKDPRVFYNREDVWVTPDELYRGDREPMSPYYITVRLPDEEKEEFILMIPFTPKDKENMIGWMAARCDSPNYGKLLVYRFSKQELTYGPMQIEARIDQDTGISQKITLWSQSGSSVVRGNTLVIPVEDSILYVEPLYLEATERGTLPQLQRVIVAYGNRLTMQDTLSEAIDVIFGTETETREPSEPGQEPGTTEQKLDRIAELYDQAQQALSEGKLGLYQEYVEQIGTLAANSTG